LSDDEQLALFVKMNRSGKPMRVLPMLVRLQLLLVALMCSLALVACDRGGPVCRGLTDESLLRDLDARTKVTQRIWDDGWADICARYGQPPRMGSSGASAWIQMTQAETDQLRSRWQAALDADGAWLKAQNRLPKCPQGGGTRATWGLHSAIGDDEPEVYCDECKNSLYRKYGDSDGLLSWRRL